jgi:FKBP-type peptidyl-prolyl cis-trans isomerase
MNRRHVVCGLITILTIAACGGGEVAQESRCAAAPDTLTIASTYSPDLDVSLSQFECNAAGLHWKVLAEGDGPVAANGDMVRVHYTGRLPDGTSFDSSIPRGEPYALVLGSGAVIRGWDLGLEGMHVGGRRILVIPPHLGYGTRGMGGVIPPDATLVFEVEMVEVIKPGA